MKRRDITMGVLITVIVLIIVILAMKISRLNSVIETMQEGQTTQENVELALCPICEKEIKVVQVRDSFYIECDDFYGDGCGLKTGYYKSKDKLIEDWNNMHR